MKCKLKLELDVTITEDEDNFILDFDIPTKEELIENYLAEIIFKEIP